MFRSLLITCSIACMILVAVAPRTAMAGETSGTSNIGFVLYTKSPSPGTLNATWMLGTRYRGPGIATGGPRTGFAGKYHVRYFHESGEFSDEYELIIEKIGDVYTASWLVNSTVAAIGVGMEVENGLAIGWRRVRD